MGGQHDGGTGSTSSAGGAAGGLPEAVGTVEAVGGSSAGGRGDAASAVGASDAVGALGAAGGSPAAVGTAEVVGGSSAGGRGDAASAVGASNAAGAVGTAGGLPEAVGTADAVGGSSAGGRGDAASAVGASDAAGAVGTAEVVGGSSAGGASNADHAASAACAGTAVGRAVAVVGETLIDLLPVGDTFPAAGRGSAPDLYQAVPGGSPANVAVGLARLGVPTRMAARVSGDPPGRILRARLAAAGVDLRGVVEAPEPSSLALVTHGPDGPVYDLRLHGTADWQWTEAELERVEPSSLAALHIGSLAAVLPPGAHEITALVRRARGTATISYDPNIRPEQMAVVPDARTRIGTLLKLADVVKLSDADLAWLAPGTDPAEFARSAVAGGAAVAVVTRGADGAVAACAGGLFDVPAVRVDVVDTVGAGDSYMSTLLTGLYSRGLLGAGARPALHAIDPSALETVLRDAALAAAITCGRRGSDPPDRDELDRVAGRQAVFQGT